MPRRTPLRRALLALLAALAIALATLTVVQSAAGPASAAPPPLRRPAGQRPARGARRDHPGRVGPRPVQGGEVVQHRHRRHPGQPGVAQARCPVTTPWGPPTRRTRHRSVRVLAFDAPAAGAVVLRRPDARRRASATSRPATARRCRPTSCCPASRLAGPYPTVVEYSGYDPSNPGNDDASPQLYNDLGLRLRRREHPRHRLLRRLLPALRAGAEPRRLRRDRDRRRPAVGEVHKVGMVGISYPGIAQLFVARTQPPHLAAITPLSVLDDSYRGTLYPGGILNTGFAVPWASAARRGRRSRTARAGSDDGRRRRHRAAPPTSCCGCRTPTGGADRGQPVLRPGLLRADRPEPAFVDKIDVPVFLAGAWQDEQTGGHFPAFLDQFTSSPHVLRDDGRTARTPSR